MTTKQLREYKAANQRRKVLAQKRNQKPVGVPVFSIQNSSNTHNR